MVVANQYNRFVYKCDGSIYARLAAFPRFPDPDFAYTVRKYFESQGYLVGAYQRPKLSQPGPPELREAYSTGVRAVLRLQQKETAVEDFGRTIRSFVDKYQLPVRR